jgi:hypothetical protein
MVSVSSRKRQLVDASYTLPDRSNPVDGAARIPRRLPRGHMRVYTCALVWIIDDNVRT